MSFAWVPWAGALLAFNPAWPAANPELPPPSLADPALQPDDPEYAPWAGGAPCRGQMSLYSFTPDCAQGLTEEERQAGVGVSVDRAWLRTIGRPTVVIAVIGDGVRLTETDLVQKIRLNPGELVPEPGQAIDRNADGVVTVDDFLSGTSTTLPTIDRVIDVRIRSRPDGGDTNQNGILDPQDILRIFSDGADTDGNGLVDDIAGWDFLTGDSDPTPASEDGAATEAALLAAANTNNGLGTAGSCPRCTVVPIRVGARRLADPHRVGAGLLYSTQVATRVTVIATSIPGVTPFLRQVIDQLGEGGVVTVIAAGPSSYPSLTLDVPIHHPTALIASARGFNQDPAEASSSSAPLFCRKRTRGSEVAVVGLTCEAPTSAAGLTAGVVGLMQTAAEFGGTGRPPPTRRFDAADLVAMVRASGSALSDDGVRIDARRAVDAVLDGTAIAPATWVTPSPGAAVDPTPGLLPVTALLSTPAGPEGLRYTVSLGRETEPLAFAVIEQGQIAPGTQRIDAIVPLEGLLEDPARPPRRFGDKTFRLRLAITPLGPEPVLESVTERLVFLDADLDLLPGFPVDLGSGVLGGPRIVDFDQDGRSEVWVALLDGRLARVGERGDDIRWVKGRTDEAARRAAELWASAAIESPSIPFLSAPSLQLGDLGPALLAVAADGVLLRLDPSGEAAHIGEAAPYDETRPAGSIAPPVFVAGLAGTVEGLMWPAPDGLRSTNGVVSPLPLGASPLAVEFRDGASIAWTTSGANLRSTERLGVSLPEPPTKLSGLLGLRPPGPVASEGNELGQGIFVRSPVGAFGWNGERVESLRHPEGLMSAGWALSAEAGRLIGWTMPIALSAAPRPIGLPDGGRIIQADITDPSLAEVVVSDVDGGAPEWIFGADTERLYAISENGRQASGWPKLTAGPVLGAPSLGDIDGDGRLELAAVTREGWLFLWRTRGQAEQAQWPAERHDAAATANTQTDPLPAAGVSANAGCGCRSQPLARRTDSRWWWGGVLAVLGLMARRVGKG